MDFDLLDVVCKATAFDIGLERTIELQREFMRLSSCKGSLFS